MDDPNLEKLVVLRNGKLLFQPSLENAAGIYDMWLVGTLPSGIEKREPFQVEVTRCEADLDIISAQGLLTDQ